MLSYTKTAVTRNQSEKKINSLLDFVSQSSDMKLLQDFYSFTLSALAEANNERLWFKTQLKLCGLWFKLKEYSRMHRILKELHRYLVPIQQAKQPQFVFHCCQSFSVCKAIAHNIFFSLLS